MARIRYLLIIVLLMCVSAGMTLSCQKSTPVIRDGVYDYKSLFEEAPTIHVLLIKNALRAEITIHGGYEIIDSVNTVLDQGTALQKSRISVNNRSIVIGNKSYEINRVRIVSLRDGDIKLNDIRYRGEIKILRQPNNTFSVVKAVDMESYIAGVVGSEMPSSWEEDALRAQAIIARTYAINRINVRRGDIYHIEMLDLAYRGMANETAKITRIVQDTKGIVIAYNWNIFPAFFHSTCGGHTEDSKHVFGIDSMPPLRGVVCNYCNNTKYSSWSVDIRKADIEKRLRESNINTPDISTVNTVDPGRSDRGSSVEIVFANGKKEMSANQFRLLVGPNLLYSTAFTSRSNGNNITFSGKGFGHGVGLCQYGAQGMAKNGFPYTSILKHYYPGIELIRLY
ncbi:MAG: SpoIID/LytB domain-containing protein [Candidatus Loosdrechtia sp.]|uniref:SpoIID/LytB domain-containing protein n=1 Tax=Candidatus Loosdrechtia sp. TaxID=3101272 RepID=UPI00403B2389